MTSFALRVQPHVKTELDAAASAQARGQFYTAFQHLERARVPGQSALTSRCAGPDGFPRGADRAVGSGKVIARAKLSELADQAKAGAEKIITKNGESDVALIDADRLDYYHRLERERIHLLLIGDARHGLADIAAGQTFEADAAIAQIQQRRADKTTGRVLRQAVAVTGKAARKRG